MMPYHFFYQLVLFGLLWLFVMLYYAWPSGGVPDAQRSVKPSTPRRTRSNEPKPFAGMTHKPPCAACEHEATPPQPPPLVPPDPMPPTNRRAYANPCWCPNRPMVRGRRRSGDPVHQPWRRDGPIGGGACCRS